ncbi:MAG: 3-keto-5-aminohexanoate cleavage protein [Actinomycetota bacterium]|nr:3-keto-5-aminohexanoate cleavage protein [Actinomycetota bacterium]
MPPRLLVQACLNGSRTDAEHPAVPRTPAAIADAARASVQAGAGVLHVHAFDDHRAETLAAAPCAAVLRAIRAVCPGVPVSLTTSADIEVDPRARHALVAAWTELPELVTANQGEPGIVELCELLTGRGVGIEAGLLRSADARAFAAAGLAGRCVRVLMEPLDADPDDAVAHAAEMERIVLDAGIALEQVHHGDDLAGWAVMRRAYERGYGTRAGIEDMTVLPDGSPAPDNAALVRAAVALQG